MGCDTAVSTQMNKMQLLFQVVHNLDGKKMLFIRPCHMWKIVSWIVIVLYIVDYDYKLININLDDFGLGNYIWSYPVQHLIRDWN